MSHRHVTIVCVTCHVSPHLLLALGTVHTALTVVKMTQNCPNWHNQSTQANKADSSRIVHTYISMWSCEFLWRFQFMVSLEGGAILNKQNYFCIQFVSLIFPFQFLTLIVSHMKQRIQYSILSNKRSTHDTCVHYSSGSGEFLLLKSFQSRFHANFVNISRTLDHFICK